MKLPHRQRLFNFLMICTLGVASTFAQTVPSPGGMQKDPILLKGGTAHLGTGEIIENALIGFTNGKLTVVSKSDNTEIKGTKWQVIDTTGKHIYPGIIAPNSQLGLIEISSIRASSDHSEIGRLNPHINAIIAYNTDSTVTPTIRSNGVLITQIAPTGGLISGSSAMVQLDAWNWQDAAIVNKDGIQIRWPSFPIQRRSDDKKRNNERKEDYQKNILQLTEFFEQAQAYCNNPTHQTSNLRFESMRGLFKQTRKAFIHTSNTKDIMAAVTFLNKFNLKGVIVGGEDAWQVTELLAKNNVPVIYMGVHTLPKFKHDDIDRKYKIPALLNEAGVDYCLGIGGFSTQRNLIFVAGNSVAYGVSKEEALMSITLNAAKILGIDHRVGSLEVNKDATLVVSTGDILDTLTSHIEMAFIEGRQVNLGNKQKDLYEKFRNK